MFRRLQAIVLATIGVVLLILSLYAGRWAAEHAVLGPMFTLDGPALIGRWQAIPKPWPSIFITEHGWAYDNAPAAGTGIPQLLETYRKWYAYDPIKGLALWTLDAIEREYAGRDGIEVDHQGNIWVESPGYDEQQLPGSTFIIQLPVAK